MDEAIVSRSQRCLAEVLKESARRCGGAVREEDGLLLVAGNHPCPVLVNSAVRTGAMDAREALRRAAAFFGERGHDWETWARDGMDGDLESAASAAGMRMAAELSGMVLENCPEVPQLGPGIEIRCVEDVRGVKEFTNVVADGFQDEAVGLSEMVRAIFADPGFLTASDTAAFVVWSGGEPASAALTMVKNGVAWIGWVATRAEKRGRGLGGVATTAAARAGFALGAKMASLEATKMGAPVYRRLGFREVLRYRTYWPAQFLG